MRVQTRDYALREHGRPEPDEAPLEAAPFSARELFGAAKRAAKSMLDDNMLMIASALAYSTFFAIPSVLLVAVGLFTLVAGPSTISQLMSHFSTVMPEQATSLLGSSLRNLDAHPASGVVMTVVGFVLALWSTTGAMNAYMTAINITYEREDRRSFLRKRIVAVEMVAAMGCAFALVAVLLMFGPQVEKLIASHLGRAGLVLVWLWWVLQWPVLLGALLAAFATLFYLGPDLEQRRWRFLTPGSLVAAVLWIVFSGLFAAYTAMFGSYNKTWGTLSAVIVTLTWLWLTGMALLLGAEINAEAERSRMLRGGAPPASKP
jgi:membrane protein